MGTNCAPTWANVVMCRFERLHQQRWPCMHNNPCYLSRFIDDGLVIHTKNNAYALRRHLGAMYLPHLKFGFMVFAQSQGIAFLHLLFVSTSPLVHTVFSKPTHSCNYIPFDSNTPTRHKTQYIKPECVRYIQLNIWRMVYELCCKRLQVALKRLKIPSRFWSPMPLQWENKPKYVQYRKRPREIVHVLYVPYYFALPMQI